jgi:hypothetical protein
VDPRVAFVAPGAAILGIVLGDALGAGPATAALGLVALGALALAGTRRPTVALAARIPPDR